MNVRDKAKSSGEFAYTALMNSLREGSFVPGDRLREEEVCERLGLSRTPVREAIRRLEAHGIIEHRPRIGAVIRRLQHAEVVELYEMRIVFERTAAQMAAKHGVEAEFDTLVILNQRIKTERSDPALSAAINQDFHQCLYHASRNRFLLETARLLNNSLLLLGPTTYGEVGRIDDVVAQHQEIIDALQARDGEKASKAAEAHLQASLRYRLKGLRM